MIRERLENEKDVKTSAIRVKLLVQVFETFDPAQLVEAGFHQYLYESIKSERVSNCNKSNYTFVDGPKPI